MPSIGTSKPGPSRLRYELPTIVQVDRVGLAPVGSAIPTPRADGLQTYNPRMGSSYSPLWSIGPPLRLDRRDPYFRLQNVTLFVRDDAVCTWENGDPVKDFRVAWDKM